MKIVEMNARDLAQGAILELMAEHNISQKELAERMGVSASRVSQLLNGKPKNISIGKLAIIFDCLGEELDFTSERLEQVKLESRAKRTLYKNFYSAGSANSGNLNVRTFERVDPPQPHAHAPVSTVWKPREVERV